MMNKAQIEELIGQFPNTDEHSTMDTRQYLKERVSLLYKHKIVSAGQLNKMLGKSTSYMYNLYCNPYRNKSPMSLSPEIAVELHRLTFGFIDIKYSHPEHYAALQAANLVVH